MQEYSKTTVELADGYILTMRPGNGAIYIHNQARDYALIAVVAPGGHTYARAQGIIDEFNNNADYRSATISRFKPASQAAQRLPF